MTKRELLRRLREKVKPHGLDAELLFDIKSVGVQGDQRTFTFPAILMGPFPGSDVLETLSNEISNEFPINRVTYELAVKKPKPPQR